ncbi:TetR/AcrR family transcriptional regulator [Williamsia sp. MIQD14]|uniref:TetR/AcrR family transcriptional regulator n=1 Tax=Williamsia sp. MIQD14 TaxID=3425703 RepID=UPI003D9FF497
MAVHRLNRDRLVAIAHAYVAENGLDALTVRRLAAAAEVTPGALYKHFRDKRDLQRAMADSVYATVDLDALVDGSPSVDQVVECCVRMRAAMLGFRDGGRIVAGSYAPFAATVAISTALRDLLAPIVIARFDAGDVAFALRNFTVGFVIEEQAYLALAASGEWEGLVAEVRAGSPAIPASASDGVAILSGDRDARFRAGLAAVLAGTVE